MPTPALTPAAIAAKFETLKRWSDTEAGRRESLSSWTTVRLDDGTLMLSARVNGLNPGRALHQFTDRQSGYLANRPQEPGDQLPALDVSVPGREAVLWRTGGVWVELWHSDTVTVLPATPVRPVRPVQARRSLLSRASARLSRTRRRPLVEETSR